MVMTTPDQEQQLPILLPEPRPADLDARRRYARLTQREAQVLQCAAWGMTNREAGAQLGISGRTAEIHRCNAIDKLRARNTADAVRIACAAGVDFGEGPAGS